MECLRLYPPIPMEFREAQKDCWVDGVFIPKGTIIYLGVSKTFSFLYELIDPIVSCIRSESSTR